jgi:capsular polysaccharide biosynthesis protein
LVNAWFDLSFVFFNIKKKIHLGVEDSSRIYHYSGLMKLGARLLINPCRTQGIHPRLWHDARQMYWSISNITATSNEKRKRINFIYIQRTKTNAMNGARLILNEESFVNLLKEYCLNKSLNYIQYDHSKDLNHIKYRIELFYNAQYIIGVHSGALSNMNFAQSKTTVIEIMPYRSQTSSLPMTCSSFNPEDLKACAGYILYTQSQLLNQTYWILPTLVNNEGNMNVDLNRVQNLLQQI